MAQNVLGEALQPCNFDPRHRLLPRRLLQHRRRGHRRPHRVHPGHGRVPGLLGIGRQRPVDARIPSSASPACSPGDQWCLCAARWQEAFEAGHGAPGRPGLDARRHPGVGAAGRPGRPRRLSQPRVAYRRSSMAQSTQHTVVSVDRVIEAAGRRRSSPSWPTPRATPRSTARASWSRPRTVQPAPDPGLDLRHVDEDGRALLLTNTVIEFEQDRRIAWQTVLSGRSAASSAGASGATSSSRSTAGPR